MHCIPIDECLSFRYFCSTDPRVSVPPVRPATSASRCDCGRELPVFAFKASTYCAAVMLLGTSGKRAALHKRVCESQFCSAPVACRDHAAAIRDELRVRQVSAIRRRAATQTPFCRLDKYMLPFADIILDEEGTGDTDSCLANARLV